MSLLETRDDLVPPTRLTLYTTTWCGYCVRLKRALARAAIDYDEIDIETDPQAAELVEYINGGYRTVPTALFPDGEAMTNPSAREVAAHLAGLS